MLSVSIFNVARYLTDSLQGPVLAHYSEADRPSLMGWGGMGWDGWDGWDGHQNGPLIFFILRYIQHYTYTNLYIYKKNVLTNFLWV